MWVEFMKTKIGRLMSDSEKMLFRALVEKSGMSEFSEEWYNNVRVLSMNDGGMGSLRFIYDTQSLRMSKQASELTFFDADGIEVIVTLNLDEKCRPFELDIWKTNFAPLIRIPKVIRNINRGDNEGSEVDGGN